MHLKKKQSNKRLSKEERQLLAQKKAKSLLIQAWVITIIIMAMMIPMWFFNYMIGGPVIFTIVLLLLSAYIVFVCGNKVLKSAWISARHLNPNMYVLTMLGTVSALLTGVLSLLSFFDIFPEIGNFSGLAGMIMVFNLSGSYIEQKLKHKSSHAIKSLISLSPNDAIIIQDNQEKTVPVSALQIGDIAVIKTGEKIPSDGVIVEGTAELDEALVTGESMPLFKKAGDTVIGGTINLEGRALIRIEKVGKETFLQQVIKLVEQAQATKPNIQLLADKVIAVFVPCILLIAITTFLSWVFFAPQIDAVFSSLFSYLNISFVSHNNPLTMALYTSIAVLVIACPCALGLATPSAIALGVGKAAQLGTLIKSGAIFEKLNYANVIAMDKTGTITQGTPQIVKIYTAPNVKEEDMMFYAAIIEKTSHHPIAKTIITYVEETYHKEIPTPTNSKTLHGKGLYGEYNNANIFVVNMQYLHENEYTIDDALNTHIKAYTDDGLSMSFVIKDNNIIGLIGLLDIPRADSKKAIRLLHKMKLDTLMITGDNYNAAHKIAEEVGIHTVFADAHPDKKLAVVNELQAENKYVIMVGDGINDAPALTQAHIGVAMGTGTDVAAEAGDMILIKATLPTLVASLQLSKKTYAIIKQNLFWAFFYNIILIPLAMLGAIHPLYAEIAMAMSSITVLSNSLRLTKFKSKI